MGNEGSSSGGVSGRGWHASTSAEIPSGDVVCWQICSDSTLVISPLTSPDCTFSKEGGHRLFEGFLLWRGFDFLVRIDPAQDLTFFFFTLPFLRLQDFCPTVSSSVVKSGIGSLSRPTDDVDELLCLVVVSEELALDLRGCVGDIDPEKGSRPKKDQRFCALPGLGVSGSTSPFAAAIFKSGIELRRCGDFVGPSGRGLSDRSRIAPAVLGLGSVELRDGLGLRAYISVRSLLVVLVREMRDEMLPESECPGLAVMVLDVSLDTKDKGLGMNSSVSENPTLARFTGLTGALASSCTGSGSVGASTDDSSVLGKSKAFGSGALSARLGKEND